MGIGTLRYPTTSSEGSHALVGRTARPARLSVSRLSITIMLARVLPLSFSSALVFAGFAPPASAQPGPAVSFVVSNDPCLIQVCGEHPSPPKIAEAGRSFQVYVLAIDAAHSEDPNYVGPAVVTTTDPRAVLPPTLTFDQGLNQFTITLMTIGDQTITVTDPIRGITGSLIMSVTAPAASVPILNGSSMLLLAGILGAAGIWLVRVQR
jgi:hypothetical protein